MSAPNKRNKTQPDSLANTKNGATFAAKARAAELNAVRARKAAMEAKDDDDEGPPMAPGSLGMLTFTKAKNRGGKASEKPLSEHSEDSRQQPAQISHHPTPTRILQRSSSTFESQQEANLSQFNAPEEAPTSSASPRPPSLALSPSPASVGPTSPNAQPSPSYPHTVYDHVIKDWVPNPVAEWKAEMQSTPRSTRGQGSAQYGRQSSSLNPNVTPSSRERNPYGKFTHEISPTSDEDSYAETTNPSCAPMRGSPGSFFDASSSRNDDPFRDQSRGPAPGFLASSAYGQSTFGPQPTSYHTAYNDYARYQQAPFDPRSYGAQSQYGSHLMNNEYSMAGQQYAYGPQSTYQQSANNPHTAVRMPPPAVRGTTQGPMANRPHAFNEALIFAQLEQLGARTKDEALQMYMSLSSEDQTKLLDTAKTNQALSGYNPANQAALATPNVRDSAPYTGFGASSKPFDQSTTRGKLMQGLDKVAQESKGQPGDTRSARTVAFDPLAQQSSTVTSSAATGSKMTAGGPSHTQSSKESNPRAQEAADRQQFRKGSDPLPGTFATNETPANQRPDNYWEDIRGWRGIMPPDWGSMGAGNAALELEKMHAQLHKRPDQSLEEAVEQFRFDSNKALREKVKGTLSERSIAIIMEGVPQSPEELKDPARKPKPIGHGRPGTAGASPSSPSSASPATQSVQDPWNNPSMDITNELLSGALASLHTHKNPQPGDPFNHYGQPPAHAIDQSVDGNKSFFDETWAQTNPPPRVGRDPRYQVESHDGRPVYFEEPGRGGRATGGRGGSGSFRGRN